MSMIIEFSINEFEKKSNKNQNKQKQNKQNNISKVIHNENKSQSIKLVNRKKMSFYENKMNLNQLNKNEEKKKNENIISIILSNHLNKSSILQKGKMNKVNSIKSKKKNKDYSNNSNYSLNKSNSNNNIKENTNKNDELTNRISENILPFKKVNYNNYKVVNLKKNFSPILRNHSPFSNITNLSINESILDISNNNIDNKTSNNSKINKTIRLNSNIKKNDKIEINKNKNNSFSNKNNIKQNLNSKEQKFHKLKIKKKNKNRISITQRNNNLDKINPKTKLEKIKKSNYKNHLTTIEKNDKKKNNITQIKQNIKLTNFINSNNSFQTNQLSQSTTIKTTSRNNTNLNIINNNNNKKNNNNTSNNNNNNYTNFLNKETIKKNFQTTDFFSTSKSYFKSKKIISIYSISMTGYSGQNNQPKVNQDKFFIENINEYDFTFIGVCDGHGENGHLVSEFLKEEIPKNFIKELKNKCNKGIINQPLLLIKCFNDSFLITSIKLINSNIDINFSGSTCASVLITPEFLITANVGDSRIIKGILNINNNIINNSITYNINEYKNNNNNNMNNNNYFTNNIINNNNINNNNNYINNINNTNINNTNINNTNINNNYFTNNTINNSNNTNNNLNNKPYNNNENIKNQKRDNTNLTFNNYYFTSDQLTTDHKPIIEIEKRRILNHGGRIEEYKDINNNLIGPKRVWLQNKNIPGLAMTRSFGDQIASTVGVISEPEVKIYNFEIEDKFLIIASDGLWEYISNDEIVKIVENYYFENNCKGAVHKLYNEAHKRWKENDFCIDDITIIIVFFE